MSNIKGSYEHKPNSWIQKKKIKKLTKGNKKEEIINFKEQFNIIYDNIDSNCSKDNKFNYCDITGYLSNNKEKLSQLYYLDSKIYQYLKNLPYSFKEEFKNLRSGYLM